MVPALLLDNVKKHEWKGIRNSQAMLLKVYTIENLLKSFYDTRCPKSSDYANRRDMIRIFNLIAKEIYGQEKFPVVEEFGSFVMDMFSSDSDLDLSISFGNGGAALSRGARIQTLRRFAKKLYALQRKGHVKNIQAVLTARVPIIKVTDCGTGIECDLSVENADGVAKSLIISMVTAIDDRFQKLSLMLKSWAKAQGINSSKDGTFNSLSLISLAAFHLQRQEPPILPPFSSILKDGHDVPNVKRNIKKFLNYGSKNQDSVAKLFTTLLIRLNSVRTLWAEGLCASIYEASWIHKTFKDRNKNICVEDFTDRSQNVARAVGSDKLLQIYHCIENSLDLIKSFTDGKIVGKRLKHLLFGPDPPLEIKNVTNPDNFSISKPPLVDPTPKKKARITGGRGGAPSTSCGSKPPLVDPTPKKKARVTGGRGGAPSTSCGSRDHATAQSGNYLVEKNDLNHDFSRSEKLRAGDVMNRQPWGMVDNQTERLGERMYGSQHLARFVQGVGEGLSRSERTYAGELRGGIEPYGNHSSNWNPWSSSFASPSLVPDLVSLRGAGIPHYLPYQASMAYPRVESGLSVGSVYSGMAPSLAPFSSEVLNRAHIQFNDPNQMPRGASLPNFL